jgi:elongation factor Ts
MADITAADVGKLREMTGAGLMDCKKALVEAAGNLDTAVDILRKKGVASLTKKAGRDTKEGLVVKYVQPDDKLGLLVEVNCETDFVARNESFRAFCDEVAKKLAANPNVDLKDDIAGAVGKIGENIKVSRHQRLDVSGNGMVAAYIHTGGKIGVLVEIGAGKDTTVAHDDFKQLVRDVTLQIAASSPVAVSRDTVPPALVAKEREIASQSDRLKGKPAQAMEKILQGVIEKYYQTVCLIDQGFVKNPEVTVKQHLDSIAKQLGDEITIRRFVRFQVGEAQA